jgi:hypothetical protein
MNWIPIPADGHLPEDVQLATLVQMPERTFGKPIERPSEGWINIHISGWTHYLVLPTPPLP